MEQAIAYDITRLFLGPLSAAPRGIDRVDLALAERVFCDGGGGNVGVIPTPWGVRAYDADRVSRGLAHLRRIWAERSAPEDDPRWAPLVARLRGERLSGPAGIPPARAKGLGGLLGELAATGFSLGRPVRRALPVGAVYLNVGQIGLTVPAFHAWLANRHDVAAVFMLHDVIPLEHPELVEPASARFHRRMVETAARHGDGLIVTTQHAGERIAAALRTLGRGELPMLARRLPLPRVFAEHRAAEPALAGCRYFVACATVEPRKNLGLLLAVWRRLAAATRDGDMPRLVIAGAAGWNAREILRPLDEDPALREHVHHVAGLSSPALATLMLGAAAVLCPSLAEGFGLPLLEANALGVPTIASDIPSHREIADATTLLLPTADAAAWEAAVRARTAGGGRRTAAPAPELSEEAYFRDIADFLDLCARRKARAIALCDDD